MARIECRLREATPGRLPIRQFHDTGSLSKLLFGVYGIPEFLNLFGSGNKIQQLARPWNLKNRMTWTFELIEADSNEKWPLPPGATLVGGRSRDADIILVDPNCSRRQFEIVVHDDHVVLNNLSQAVPTICNGVSVETTISLNHMAEIKVGSTCLILGMRQSDGERPGNAELSTSSTGESARASGRRISGHGASTNQPDGRLSPGLPSKHSEADIPGQMTQSIRISDDDGPIESLFEIASAVGPGFSRRQGDR
jgi:pSer/pThr/pTyr-binding forkhead associated (FHA) protein